MQADLGQSESGRTTATPERKGDTKVEEDEEVSSRLDEIGFKVGWALVERCVSLLLFSFTLLSIPAEYPTSFSLARDKPRFPAAPPPSLSSSASATPQSAPSESHILDLVKFVCKDVWISLYDKQVDNLRTNHRGVYVLVDNAFKPLAKVSAVKGDKDAEEEVQRYVRFVSVMILFLGQVAASKVRRRARGSADRKR